MSSHPNPAAIPDPFAIHPNVTRTGRDDHRLGRGWRRRCGNDRLADRRSAGDGGWRVPGFLPNASADIAAGDTSFLSLGCAIDPAVQLSGIPAENQGDRQPSGQWLSTPVINQFPNLAVSIAPDTR